MKFRFFTKVSPHKRFYFSPRYYDERKERLDRMVESYANNDEVSEEKEQTFRQKEALRQAMSETWGRERRQAKHSKSANLRVVLIIIAMLLLGYLIFRPTAGSSPENETIIHQLD